MKGLLKSLRTDKNIIEAREEVEKALITKDTDLSPYYPTIIEALNELLARRKQAEVTNRIYDRSIIV